MMRTILKNKCIYWKKIGRLPPTEAPAGTNDIDVDSVDGNQEAASEESGDEQETFSISDDGDKDEKGHESCGKRKMAVQGGAGGKRAKV